MWDNVERVAHLFGFTAKLEQPAKSLSQGDKKLLDVASAFALKPEIILLDEPTSGVSTAEKATIMQVLVEAAKHTGIKAIIQVEHDMDIVFGYSSRIIAVHNGRILADGTALNLGGGEAYYYVAIDKGVNAVELFAARGGDVLTVRMNARPGKEAEFITWFRTDYLPRTLKLVGFIAGDLYRTADLQLVSHAAPFEFVAVYHLGDAMMAIESFDSHLAQPGTILDSELVDGAGVMIAAYTPISSRLTAEQARNLTPAQKALEDRFRAAMPCIEIANPQFSRPRKRG